MKCRFIILGFLLVLLASASAINAGTDITFEEPILISSAGQSADVKLVGMLAKRQKLDASAITMAQESDLKGIKTLIIVPGFSSKGLGAAGISQKEEMDRVDALVTAAQKQNIPIVMVHIGGTARRGQQSDEFNKTIAMASKYMIVVKQGDNDNFFSDIAKEKLIPIETVDKIAQTAVPLHNLFKKPEMQQQAVGDEE